MSRTIVSLIFFAAAALALAGNAQAADPAKGKEVFVKTNCNSCHGMEGKGDGPVAAALDPKPRDYTKGNFKFDANGDGKPGTDEDLALVIKNGAASYGGSAMMMPNPTLSDEDVQQLIAYIRSLKQ